MSDVCMSYIAIKKDNHEFMNLRCLILQILDDISESRETEKMYILLGTKKIEVIYCFNQKDESNCCYLEFRVKSRVNVAIDILQRIDSAISQNDKRMYYELIKQYDGISENYCIKLYPKIAKFDRLFRKIILTILLNAYGLNAYNETINGDIKDEIDRRTKGNRVISIAIENMDYKTIEIFLFSKRNQYLLEEFYSLYSKVKLSKMDKNDICNILEEYRPKSLWETNFENIGDADVWESKIKSIHETRNKVAHNKSISREEFVAISRKINHINSELNTSVIKLVEENFTENQKISILDNFASLSMYILETSSISNEFARSLTSILEITSKRLSEILKTYRGEYLKYIQLLLPAINAQLASVSNTLGRVSTGVSVRAYPALIGTTLSQCEARISTISNNVENSFENQDESEIQISEADFGEI